MKKVYVVVEGNYALSRNIKAFSTKELAEGFRSHCNRESKEPIPRNVFELEIDEAVLKEEDL